MKRTGFKAVEAIGAALPGVEVATTWGAPALKVRGNAVTGERTLGAPSAGSTAMTDDRGE